MGKDADLAIWSGDPLSTFTRCVSTWVDGRNLWNLALDRQHRERNRSERERLVQKLLAQGSKGRTTKKGAGAPSGPKHDHDHDHDHDADATREHYLHLLRMGIDPEAARCGQCGVKEHRR